MLTAFRTWLESELKLLGNASHHAYSFGQANMAKRAIDRLDEELAGGVGVILTRAEARAAVDAVDVWPSAGGPVPAALRTVHERLRAALDASERSLREEPPVV